MNHPKFPHMHSHSSWGSVFLSADESRTGKMNLHLKHCDKICLKRSGTFLKNMILHILVNRLHVLCWMRLQRWKKELPLSQVGLNRENLAFKRAVPLYLPFLLWVQCVYEDITCISVTDKKANQKFSTSENELPKIHRCFILLLKLFVKIFQVGIGTEIRLLTSYWSITLVTSQQAWSWNYFNKDIQHTVYAALSIFS